MDYRQVGRSGLTVSTIGLGCNRFGVKADAKQCEAMVTRALEHGITMFDVADVYGDPPGRAEEYLGKALKGRRDEVVLATKFGNPPDLKESRTSRRYVRRAVESSLRRLGTEWIDLYQLHGPDARTPVEETLSVLDDLVQEGKIRYIGTSMHSAWEVVEAQFVAEIKGYTRFVSTQAQYNILHRAPEQELVRACRRYAVGLIPFFPLEQGLLTGKYRRDASPQGARLTESRGALTEERFTVVEALESFGRERGVGVLDVALGWLVQMPTVATVIAGATTPEQISANVAATEWEPTLDDLKILDTISPPPAQALHRQRPAWTR